MLSASDTHPGVGLNNEPFGQESEVGSSSWTLMSREPNADGRWHNGEVEWESSAGIEVHGTEVFHHQTQQAQFDVRVVDVHARRIQLAVKGMRLSLFTMILDENIMYIIIVHSKHVEYNRETVESVRLIQIHTIELTVDSIPFPAKF